MAAIFKITIVLIVEHDVYTKHLVTTNQRFTRDISPSHDPLSFNKNFEEMAIDILRSFCSRKINHFEIALDCRRIGENKAKDKVYYTDVHLVVSAYKLSKHQKVGFTTDSMKDFNQTFSIMQLGVLIFCFA